MTDDTSRTTAAIPVAGQAEEDTIRLFTGLAVPHPIRDYLEGLMDGLAGNGLADIRWEKPENLHLTLNFLGDQPRGTAQHALEAMQSVTRDFPVFRIGVAGLSAFQNHPPQRSVIFVRPYQGLPELSWLHNQLQQALCLNDQLHWVPHVTLGQTPREHDPEGLMQRLIDAKMVHLPSVNLEEQDIVHLHWDVERVSLFRSAITDAGPVFTPVGAAELWRRE